MKFGIVLGVLAVLAVVGVFATGHNKPSTARPANQQVLAASSKQLPSGTKIYDVRTAEEYAVSHVADATLFALTDMQSGKLPDVPKDTAIAVYCRSGNRSNQATQLLRAAGYSNITDMGGLANLADYGLRAE